jgi:4-hydroxybenzoate polyprenyltransferase
MMPLSRAAVAPYVAIARVDHWFKNTFMLFGVLLAMFYQPHVVDWHLAPRLLLAIVATCLIASSNYVLNELLDAPRDASLPQKRMRPVPAGLVKSWIAVAEWAALAVAGVLLAVPIGPTFVASAVALWTMGLIYNVPPIRTKEHPYVDVLTESINNPIRLLLGWFTVIGGTIPPVSLLIAYWMAGAFFMAMKRYAEFRHIGDAEMAAGYRRSFAYYTEDRLLVSVIFYATASAFFAGIFVVRYHLELILFAPFGAGLFAQYLKLGLLPNSPAQHPERLYKHRAFVAYLVVCLAMFVGLMFVEIPKLYDWFNVEQSGAAPLWRIE